MKCLFFIILVFLTTNFFSQEGELDEEPPQGDASVAEENSDETASADTLSADASLTGDAASDSASPSIDAVSSAQADSASDGENPPAEEYDTSDIPIPPKTSPKPADAEKLAAAQNADSDGEILEKNQKTIEFGTPSEIVAVIEKALKEDDVRYIDSLYEIFYKTRSLAVKAKILEYFGKLDDPCLADYVVELLSDITEADAKIVAKALDYVHDTKITAACPALVKILEDEARDNYFSPTLVALGAVGGDKEAKYITQYLERDDLTNAERQSLMQALGSLGSTSTDVYDKVLEVAEDTSEDTFTRARALETLGKMSATSNLANTQESSVDTLVRSFEGGDPNIRQYCVKGLAPLSSNENALNTILEAIKDDHWKVRLEAIKVAKDQKIATALDNIKYRARNDAEMVVKTEAIKTLGVLGANDVLVEMLGDKKVGDITKAQIAAVLMEAGSSNDGDVIKLAKEAVESRTRKKLVAELGKLFIKYARDSFGDICVAYLQSKDTVAQQQGLAMYKNKKYPAATSEVERIANDRGNSNKKGAKKILGIEE